MKRKIECSLADFITAEKYLNKTISSLLYGGGGDASWGELEPATNIYQIMKLLQMKILDEEDLVLTLTKENVCNYNFLENKPTK